MAINLLDICKPLEPVILPSGREVRVVKVNGAVAELREKFQQTNDYKLLWEIVGHLLPDATKKEVASLNEDMCLAVLQIAAGNADKILAEMAAEAKEKRAGNPKATASQKPKARRRVTG